ncbi:MAG: endonuclease III [Elusimicrobia bacterium]|nr:endonuclease III [Elusimicrobiota bacterium]
MAKAAISNRQTRAILKRFDKLYPGAHYYLNFSNPLELLVAVVLSAQTRDQAVNAATPKLFARFKTAQDYARSTPEEIQRYIAGINFSNTKSKNIHKACAIIAQKHNGRVPQTMEALIELPGIGRKSANAVLINAFNKVIGVVVDTHVIRLANRLGFSKNTDPKKIEQDLMNILPKNYWVKITYFMKEHGRAVCRAPKALCGQCRLADLCPKVGVTSSRR